MRIKYIRLCEDMPTYGRLYRENPEDMQGEGGESHAELSDELYNTLMKISYEKDRVREWEAHVAPDFPDWYKPKYVEKVFYSFSGSRECNVLDNTWGDILFGGYEEGSYIKIPDEHLIPLKRLSPKDRIEYYNNVIKPNERKTDVFSHGVPYYNDIPLDTKPSDYTKKPDVVPYNKKAYSYGFNVNPCVNLNHSTGVFKCADTDTWLDTEGGTINNYFVNAENPRFVKIPQEFAGDIKRIPPSNRVAFYNEVINNAVTPEDTEKATGAWITRRVGRLLNPAAYQLSGIPYNEFTAFAAGRFGGKTRFLNGTWGIHQNQGKTQTTAISNNQTNKESNNMSFNNVVVKTDAVLIDGVRVTTPASIYRAIESVSEDLAKYEELGAKVKSNHIQGKIKELTLTLETLAEVLDGMEES